MKQILALACTCVLAALPLARAMASDIPAPADTNTDTAAPNTNFGGNGIVAVSNAVALQFVNGPWNEKTVTAASSVVNAPTAVALNDFSSLGAETSQVAGTIAKVKALRRPAITLSTAICRHGRETAPVLREITQP